MKSLFYAHDAGGAQAVAPVIKLAQEKGNKVIVYADGPARSILERKAIAAKDPSALNNADITAAAAAVFGTSVGDTFDKKLLQDLRGKIPTVAIIDYWSNYRMRFTDGSGHFIEPDLILVIDEAMKEQMIKEGFDEARIIITGNPHFDNFTEGIKREREDPKEVLFISQPLSTLRKYTDFGFDEFSALTDLKEVLKNTKYSLVIRLHPKDELGKYDSYLNERTTLSNEKSLEDAISRAGVIIGMISPVLIQAAGAGKRVLSYEPGLKVADPLESNTQGITERAINKDELSKFFSESRMKKQVSIESIGPKGATARALRAIEQAAKS